jgi:hypothetical protein
MRIVGYLRGAKACEIEGRVEGEPGRSGGARFLHLAEVGERRAKMEMVHGEFVVAADALPQPHDCLFVAAERVLGVADEPKPGESESIERAEPQGFADMAFGLLGPAEMEGVQPHQPVGMGEVGIELERVFRFSHRTFDAIGHAHYIAKNGVSLGVIGSEQERLRRIPLRRCQTGGAVLGAIVRYGEQRIDEGGPDERVDILGIDPQRLGKEGLRAQAPPDRSLC